MPLVENLELFLADFGQPATLDGAAVSVIYDNSYAFASVGPFGMAGTRPQVRLRTTSVPATPVGKALVVNGANYTVADHQPDGTGMSVLILEAA
jgi:hypothetical protein